MNTDTTSTIVAPAMRFVPVSDAVRSIAFYRDVLGFVEQEVSDDYGVGALAEVVLGAVRIQFCPLSQGKDDDRLILFFETDDAGLLRETILARGATASSLQRVNWIKMEMFEVRDLDGHTLWFGQSFDQPHKAQPQPMLLQALPHLPLNDVTSGVAYYQDMFGFKINYAQDDLGVMYRDKVTLLLIQRTEAHTGIGSCSAYIENADELYAELVNRGAKVQGAPVSRPWGLRDFTVVDLEGNTITFAQPFE